MRSRIPVPPMRNRPLRYGIILIQVRDRRKRPYTLEQKIDTTDEDRPFMKHGPTRKERSVTNNQGNQLVGSLSGVSIPPELPPEFGLSWFRPCRRSLSSPLQSQLKFSISKIYQKFTIKLKKVSHLTDQTPFGVLVKVWSRFPLASIWLMMKRSGVTSRCVNP